MNKQKSAVINLILVLCIVVGIITIALFTADQMGFFQGEPKQEIKAEHTCEDDPILRVAADYDFCPNSYFNSENELTGLYIEVITEVANRLGMNPVFLTDTWIKSREKLTNGEVDVLLGLEIFSNMDGTLKTIPICSDELCVFGKTKVDSAAALAGKRVALMARSVIISTFDLQCEYVEYNTNTDILEAVENGEVDYAICHAAVSEKTMEKNKLDLIQGVTIMKSFPAMAVKESNPELREQLNSVLQAMAEDGTLYRLRTKWIDEFTKDRSFAAIWKENQAFYITTVMAILLLTCITFLFRMNDKKQEKYICKLLDYQKQLQISNEEAEKASRVKTEFLSHMSHDIRTPINGIIGMARMIRRDPGNTKKTLECLDKIDVASNHLLSLINDVLDMSKLESGNVEAEHVPFSLDEEMKNIRVIADDQAQEKHLHVLFDVRQIRHRYLVGSPGHLRRILLNLFSNAIKYTPEDGTICVTAKELLEHNGKVVLEFCVQDNGVGMSREFIEKHLYKPFTQERDSARSKYQGTGLGLAIVHNLIDIMQGTIRVDSEPDHGTTFTVTLPFDIGTEPVQTETSEVKADCIREMKVLLVEDNALNCEIAQALLEEYGAVVTTAADGRQAVELFKASPVHGFDAILMDIMMPVLDGLAASREIRHLARKDAASIPIIAMTANAFAEDQEKSFNAGMNEHLTKPLDQHKLLKVLAKYYKKKNES